MWEHVYLCTLVYVTMCICETMYMNVHTCVGALCGHGYESECIYMYMKECTSVGTYIGTCVCVCMIRLFLWPLARPDPYFWRTVLVRLCPPEGLQAGPRGAQ